MGFLDKIAGPIIGGLFGLAGEERREDVAAENRASAEAQAARNAELQKEFAQHGIRWRVEDARQAGLHPLFALSGGGAAFAPNPIVVGGDSGRGQWLSDLGQNLGRAVAAQETQEQREQRVLAQAVAQSQINRNNAEAMLFETQAGNLRGINPPMPSAMPLTEDGRAPAGQVVVKPNEITSPQDGDPSMAAGPGDVGWRKIWITPHLYAYFPHGDEGWAETWGELSWYDKLIIMQRNEALQPGFKQRFLNEFVLGKAPMPAAQPLVRGDKFYPDWDVPHRDAYFDPFSGDDNMPPGRNPPRGRPEALKGRR